MYEWTEPYEDEYIKERIEELRTRTERGDCRMAKSWSPPMNSSGCRH